MCSLLDTCSVSDECYLPELPRTNCRLFKRTDRESGRCNIATYTQLCVPSLFIRGVSRVHKEGKIAAWWLFVSLVRVVVLEATMLRLRSHQHNYFLILTDQEGWQMAKGLSVKLE